MSGIVDKKRPISCALAVAAVCIATAASSSCVFRAEAPTARKPTQPSRADAFPAWAHRATVAGAAFEPDDPWSETRADIDDLVRTNTTAVVADCPLGWSYEAWVDDAEFRRNLALVRDVTRYAHAKGLKVVWYVTGLELISEGGRRNPAAEHPSWVQRAIDGSPIAFRDIGSTQEHWLNKGDWDVWVSPDEPTFRALYTRRIRALAGTGIDALWVDTVYLQDAIGTHDTMWPSLDRASRTSFERDTGLEPPQREDWDSAVFKRWIAWRHLQLKRFLVDVKEAARRVNPKIVLFEENWVTDTGGGTTYANDPVVYHDQPDLSTAHEISTVGDRVDEGETGMAAATVTNWQDFTTMVKFARGADGAKPSWILTYGYRPADAARLAGIIVAAGANYYETQGPAMDSSVGTAYRTRMFAWIRANARYLYEGRPNRRVALLYSPTSRDFIDGGAGDYYSTTDTEFFAGYRGAARALIGGHVPFDVVPDTSITATSLAPYAWVVEPAHAVSDAQIVALRDYVANGGKLVLLPGAGERDEWGNDRSDVPLRGIRRHTFDGLMAAEKRNQLLGPSIHIEERSVGRWRTALIVNFARTTRRSIRLQLTLPRGEKAREGYITAPGTGRHRIPVAQANTSVTARIPTLDAFALVLVRV